MIFNQDVETGIVLTPGTNTFQEIQNLTQKVHSEDFVQQIQAARELLHIFNDIHKKRQICNGPTFAPTLHCISKLLNAEEREIQLYALMAFKQMTDEDSCRGKLTPNVVGLILTIGKKYSYSDVVIWREVLAIYQNLAFGKTHKLFLKEGGMRQLDQLLKLLNTNLSSQHSGSKEAMEDPDCRYSLLACVCNMLFWSEPETVHIIYEWISVLLLVLENPQAKAAEPEVELALHALSNCISKDLALKRRCLSLGGLNIIQKCIVSFKRSKIERAAKVSDGPD